VTSEEVHFVKSRRANTISLTIRPFEGVRISVPHHVTQSQAKAFVQSKKKWIAKHQARLSQVEKEFNSFHANSEFSTRNHRLVILRSPNGKASGRIANGQIRVSVPEDIPIQSPEIQRLIRRGIEVAWRKEAKSYLPGRVAQLARKKGLFYKDVRIKKMRTRWGSCSRQNMINLNLHLMRLEDRLLDYVILHELVHTVVKNHGAEFWKRLDEVMGCESKGVAKELRGSGIVLW